MGSIFSKAKGAKPAGGGAYFTPGDYVVKVNRFKRDEKRGGRGEFVAIECLAMESNNGGKYPQPGQDASNYIDGAWDGAGAMLVDFAIAFVETSTGESAPEDQDERDELFDEKFFDELAGEDQPAAGMFFGLKVLPPKEGKKFQPHRWRSLDEEELKRVKALDKKGARAVAAK
jgi:hypothetical protein